MRFTSLSTVSAYLIPYQPMAHARYARSRAVCWPWQRSSRPAAAASTRPRRPSHVSLRDRLAACESADEDAMRACYTSTLTRIVGAARDPRPVVDRITAIAWTNPTGFLLPNCHVMMHTVGRSTRAGITSRWRR